MNVSVDRDQCISSGLCEVIAPDVFLVADDGLVRLLDEPSAVAAEGSVVTCLVKSGREEAVQEAADQCPGACIFVGP
ncbi:MAG: ferredoxin [Frankiaceae bacterium]|jgi:ferredoxin|nr:ferredoxin [Frankiaceae bacterium]